MEHSGTDDMHRGQGDDKEFRMSRLVVHGEPQGSDQHFWARAVSQLR